MNVLYTKAFGVRASARSAKHSIQYSDAGVYLPDNVDEKRIEASLEHGVLTVSIPKIEKKQKPAARKINIKSA